MLSIQRTNTILYCARWEQTVAFYREGLGLPVTFVNDWFVELQLTDGGYLSVADGRRASIEPNHGTGLTLSWQVPDVAVARRELAAAGIEVPPTGSRWGAATLDLHDPEHNRIELWSEVTPA